MTLLIYSLEGDVHADAVAWVYRSRGGRCDIVDYGEFPTERFVSASISDSAPMAVGSREVAHGHKLDHSSYRVVWNRRIGPLGKVTGLAEQDAPIVERVGRGFLDDVRGIEAPGQTWVNARLNQVRADNKLFQLRLARDLGFTIPETLVSNDPDEIREFVGRRAAAIVKPTRPIHWEGEEAMALPTTPITVEQLRRDLPVIACPMIYQARVEKRFEVRVAVFGSELVACKLSTQQNEQTRVDSRIGSLEALNIEPLELPSRVGERIRQFMRRADLLHGSFDFAVSNDDDYVFFEINEQGQSLWIEECNPEIRILDRMVSFLEEPDADFRWDGQCRASYADWLAIEEREKREPVSA